MLTMFWIWMAALVVFLVLELMTPTLVFACFVVGAFVSGIFAVFMPEAYYWQIGIFVGVSLILLPLTRSLAKKITKDSPQLSNVDALIGNVALVTKEIDPDLGGQVQIKGEIWVAKSDEHVPTGAKVTITSVSGTKVNVKRIQEEEV